MGSTCRTTWWPSGVSTGDRGSSNALYWIELVAVHDPDQLDAVAGLDGQVAGQRHVGHAEPLAQDGDRLLVPGQLAVVVAGGYHHAVILVRGEVLDRVGELGVGIQDPGHIRGRGQHLEPVAGDDQHPGQLEGVQHLGQFVSGAGGYLRRRGREVQVAHHDHPAAPPHLEPDEIGDEDGIRGPVRGRPRRQPGERRRAARPSSRFSSRAVMSRLRAHDREQDDVADRRDLGQQHDQPVDADADAGGRW